nr:nickel pincer cofactor biosynthesis protein LarC [uncultured Clostridium sp.]
MKKILYLECNSGISGDMTVGALLDLGADQEVLVKALQSLNLSGYHLHFGRTKKCGLDAYDFDVHLEAVAEHDHSHTDMDGHAHSHETDHSHDHAHEHSHEHTHNHEHSHSHENHHSHEHRNIGDIYEIIDRLAAGERVKAMARRMFDIVAEAEAKAHGIPLEEVHFHEVGAVDSIIDIIGTAVCVDNLGVDKIIVSPLSEGSGSIRCQHGVIPVPVPATANIASAYGLKLRLTDNEGEMVTPTGAAIAAALKTTDRLPSSCQILKTGMGAGKKDFKQANILRAMILSEEEDPAGDEMWVLESNIDDSSGEALGLAMESLLDAGAADVWYTPVFMKKNRPAYMLSVICEKDKIETMEEILFIQTTTIGIRRYSAERTVLPREKRTVMTQWGEAEVKVCKYKDREFCYPEYESVKTLCRKSGLDYQTIYRILQKEG